MNSSQNLQTRSFTLTLSQLLELSNSQTLPDLIPSTDLEIPQDVPESAPENDNRIKIKIVVNNVRNTHNTERNYAESEFKRSFDRFFRKYCSYQRVALMFFLILIIGAAESQLFAITLFFGLVAGYLAHLATVFSKARLLMEKFRIIYQVVESSSVAAFIVWSLINFNQGTIFFVFLLISYLFKTIVGYCCNRSELIKFTNQVNRSILFLRICVFLQGVLLLLVQGSMDFKIPSYLVYIPLYAIILVIARFVLQLLKSIYSTCHEQFWSTAVNEKQAGVKYIIGNLFGLISILSLQSLILLFDLSEVEMLVYFGIVAWCTISLLLSESRRDTVFKVCDALAKIYNENIPIPSQISEQSQSSSELQN